jgi:hypothetical protein
MCGSKSAAEALAMCFKSAGPDLNVGVCTSERKVRGKVDEIWKDHDVIIFTSVYTTGADFQLQVARVYVMPKVGVATAREMIQGSGRFRNIVTGEFVVGVEAEAEAACAITCRELDARYEQEAAALGRLRDLRMRSMRIAECAGVGVLDMHMVRPFDLGTTTNDMLVMAAAYDRAERHFSSTMALWIGTFKYMCAAKGYDIKVQQLDMPTEEGKDLGMGIKHALDLVKEGRERQLKKIDVSPFAREEAFQVLQRMAAGGVGISESERG